MWELELRNSKDGTWQLWTKGTLEECLTDLWEFKRGSYGDVFDAARLTTEVS